MSVLSCSIRLPGRGSKAVSVLTGVGAQEAVVTLGLHFRKRECILGDYDTLTSCLRVAAFSNVQFP